MNEAQLIRKAVQGDGAAVRSLYERYSPRVYAVVRRIAADDDLAHDYAQEAWIRAIRALPSFRGDSRFSTWLHRIAVNSSLQAVRRAETRQKREAPMPETIAVAPPRMRTVMILHVVEGYTHDEIGELLGTAPGTSKSQLFKARGKMRELLKALNTPEDREELEVWSI
jgi:RNA polymerase sigma-70 factor (ECF subfamily)